MTAIALADNATLRVRGTARLEEDPTRCHIGWSASRTHEVAAETLVQLGPIVEAVRDVSARSADNERDHGKSSDGLCDERQGFRLFLPLRERTLGHFPAINSAAFSAMAMIGRLVFPLITVGISEPSITRRLSMPRTRSLLSTTASRSSPMRHVPTGW